MQPSWLRRASRGLCVLDRAAGWGMLSVTPDPVLLHHLLLKARGDSSRAKLALKKLLRVLAGSKNSSGEKTQGDKYLGEGRGMHLPEGEDSRAGRLCLALSLENRCSSKPWAAEIVFFGGRIGLRVVGDLSHLLLSHLLSLFQYIFVSLISRDSVYDVLRRVCTHLQVPPATCPCPHPVSRCHAGCVPLWDVLLSITGPEPLSASQQDRARPCHLGVTEVSCPREPPGTCSGSQMSGAEPAVSPLAFPGCVGAIFIIW